MKPWKVVHLITKLELGGAQGNTIHTVLHHTPEKIESHLWCGQGGYWDNRLPNQWPRTRFRFIHTLVRPLHPIKDILCILELYVAFRSLKPLIVHTHSSKAGIVGRIAAWLARVPIVVHTFHGFGFNDQQKPFVRRFFIFLEKITAPMSDTLIFVSQSNWDEAADKKVGKTAQYALIRSGIPIKAIKQEAIRSVPLATRQKLGIPESAYVILTIGAFKPQKNLVDFIQFARAVHEQVPDTFFVIVGEGEQRALLEKEAKNHRLTDRVLFTGWRSDLPQIMAASHLFVMTSLWEGLPRTLLEALIVGVPSLCYETDGVRDLKGTPGLTTIERGNLPALIETGLSYIKKSLIQRPRPFSVDLDPSYDIDAMVQSIEDLYTGLVDKNHLNH